MKPVFYSFCLTTRKQEDTRSCLKVFKHDLLVNPNICESLISLVSQPCHLKNWEMQVHFKIHGQGKKNLNGDGLAIWYTKERMQKGERHRMCHSTSERVLSIS